jgi:hypothetical protein
MSADEPAERFFWSRSSFASDRSWRRYVIGNSAFVLHTFVNRGLESGLADVIC